MADPFPDALETDPTGPAAQDGLSGAPAAEGAPVEPGAAITALELEALLFVAEKPLSRTEIGRVCRVDAESVDHLLGDLEVALRGRQGAFRQGFPLGRRQLALEVPKEAMEHLTLPCVEGRQGIALPELRATQDAAGRLLGCIQRPREALGEPAQPRRDIEVALLRLFERGVDSGRSRRMERL